MPIRSFRDKTTRRVWLRQVDPRVPPSVQRAALRKLLMLDAAGTLQDLSVPHGNRLERLHGDRKGQHSIRVNNQWRLCFSWVDDGAYNVELVDYH